MPDVRTVMLMPTKSGHRVPVGNGTVAKSKRGPEDAGATGFKVGRCGILSGEDALFSLLFVEGVAFGYPFITISPTPAAQMTVPRRSPSHVRQLLFDLVPAGPKTALPEGDVCS